jgi:hypothetical protein
VNFERVPFHALSRPNTAAEAATSENAITVARQRSCLAGGAPILERKPIPDEPSRNIEYDGAPAGMVNLVICE